MTPDSELLATFARTNSGDAFAEVVKRHAGLVYSAARRQVNGDEHLAQDVAQTVFTDLAKKAARLSRRDNLSGWLYSATHFAAANAIRTETRRRDREEKFMRESVSDGGTGVSPVPSAGEWKNFSTSLDAAMHELKEADRDAILLRYFENRPFAEVGAKLGLNENAARMRVERALEKLRAIFAKRGIATTAGFAAAISANAIQVAPAGLAATLTVSAISSVGTGTFTLLKMMTATKIKLGLAALVVAGGATAFVLQQQAQEKLLGDNAALQQQLAQLQTDNQNLSNRLATVGDSKKLSDSQFNELLKLRGEVGVLQNQKSQVAKLQEENRQLRLSQVVRDAGAGPASEMEQEHKFALQELNRAKQGVLALLMFQADNENISPSNYLQMATYITDTNFLNKLEANYDLLQIGATTNISIPSATIVLKEKQAWQTSDGKWAKVYGFADGHAELHTEADGNFENWEKERMVSPPKSE